MGCLLWVFWRILTVVYLYRTDGLFSPFTAHVQCFGGDCFPVAFGVPAALMLLSLSKYWNILTQYIESWTKWLTFCRQHFLMHFSEWSLWILIEIALNLFLRVQLIHCSKLALMYVMAWHWTCNKPWPKPKNRVPIGKTPVRIILWCPTTKMLKKARFLIQPLEQEGGCQKCCISLCSKVFINHFYQMKASPECLSILIYWSKYWVDWLRRTPRRKV